MLTRHLSSRARRQCVHLDEISAAAGRHSALYSGPRRRDRRGTTGADLQRVHAGNIDVCEVHSYDAANDALPAVISQRIAQCQALSKPIFASEVGVCTNVQPDGSRSGTPDAITLAQRGAFMQSKLTSSYEAGLGGFLVWTWDPRTPTTDVYAVSHGDPLEAVLAKARP